jgi:hypothetical protein
MNIEDISREIVKIRGRLRQIEEERKGLSDDDLAAKTALHDEEIEIRARLAQLQEMTTAAADPSTTAKAK